MAKSKHWAFAGHSAQNFSASVDELPKKMSFAISGARPMHAASGWRNTPPMLNGRLILLSRCQPSGGTSGVLSARMGVPPTLPEREMSR